MTFMRLNVTHLLSVVSRSEGSSCTLPMTSSVPVFVITQAGLLLSVCSICVGVKKIWAYNN